MQLPEQKMLLSLQRLPRVSCAAYRDHDKDIAIYLHPKQRKVAATDPQLNHEPKGPCMHQNLKGIIWSLLFIWDFLMIFRKLPSSPKVASLRRKSGFIFLKNQHVDVHYLSLWRCTNINDVHKKMVPSQPTQFGRSECPNKAFNRPQWYLCIKNKPCHNTSMKVGHQHLSIWKHATFHIFSQAWCLRAIKIYLYTVHVCI